MIFVECNTFLQYFIAIILLSFVETMHIISSIILFGQSESALGNWQEPLSAIGNNKMPEVTYASALPGSLQPLVKYRDRRIGTVEL